MSSLLALILTAVAGAGVALQAPINAALAGRIGSPLSAAALSFGVGFLALAALATLTAPGGFTGLREAPLWMFLGGLLGAVYVASMIMVVPVLGVTTAIAALILGQLSAALALDAIGAFGIDTRPVDAQRLLAVALVAAGVLLSRG